MDQKLLHGKINSVCGNVLFVSDNAGDFDDERIGYLKEFFKDKDYKVNLAEGSAVLKFSLTDELRQTLKDKGGYEAAGRVVTFKVKIGENTYRATIEELRVHMTVTIKGLSFTHMNSDISAWLEFTYDETENNFTTLENAVEYSSSAIVDEAAGTNAIAAAFKDLMN
jgi:hypothetical protein